MTTYSEIRVLHQNSDTIIFLTPHDDATHGFSFYTSDGTVSGTREVFSGSEGRFASIDQMRLYNGELYVPVIEDDNDRCFIVIIGEDGCASSNLSATACRSLRAMISGRVHRSCCLLANWSTGGGLSH